jgi:hypothetical protein
LQRANLARERLLRELERLDKRVEAMELAASAKADEVGGVRDFWPDTVDLEGGTMEVKDKSGAVVATLRITGNNVERWLIDADVEKPKTAQISPAPAESGVPAGTPPTDPR